MSIHVYTMVEADKLVRLGKEIAKALFHLPASVVGGEVFSIARGSGFLYYADPAKLWTDLAKQALPKTEADARTAAIAFLARAERDVEDDPRLKKTELRSILPPVDSLLHLLTTPVRHPSNEQIDHWLCRFAVTIPPSDSLDEPAAPIAGAGIDLRIGDRGEVIGLTSRWVPLRRGHRTRPRRHLPRLLRDEHGQPPAARLVYRLNDEAARQTFLAPYWLVADGHHQVFFPASDYSLACEILQSPGQGKITLTAITAGGTGAYKYTWGRALVTQFPPRIERIGGNTRTLRLGTQETTVSSVSIDASVCDVLLDVRDTGTGARVQLRRSIYPLMTISPEPAPASVLPPPHPHVV